MRKLALVFLCSCTAVVGSSSVISVPKDAAATCATNCKNVGLPLGAVVIMASNVGCVCQAPAATSANGAAAAAGMATLLMERQEEDGARRH